MIFTCNLVNHKDRCQATLLQQKYQMCSKVDMNWQCMINELKLLLLKDIIGSQLHKRKQTSKRKWEATEFRCEMNIPVDHVCPVI